MKTDREFILDDMDDHAENECECHNHEDCNRAMAALVRRLLKTERWDEERVIEFVEALTGGLSAQAEVKLRALLKGR